jgi:gluconolactonase
VSSAVELSRHSQETVASGEPWPQVRPGLGFLEGPVWLDDGTLVCVAMDSGLLYQLDGGVLRRYALTGGGPNGAAVGPGGEVYVAQNGGMGNVSRRWPGVIGGVQVVSRSGQVRWLTQDPVSPNDLCFGPDGLLYVTDPTRGVVDDGRIWRCDPASGRSQLLASVGWYPNGIGFGPDDDALYVANTFERCVVRYRFPVPARLGPPEVFARLDHGLPDGFAFDVEGNLIVAAIGEQGRPGDVQVFDRAGRLVERVEIGPSQEYTNLALGRDGRLAIADATTGSVLVVAWPTAGVPLHPRRDGSEPAR